MHWDKIYRIGVGLEFCKLPSQKTVQAHIHLPLLHSEKSLRQNLVFLIWAATCIPALMLEPENKKSSIIIQLFLHI
jgi:hypothetical protein